MTNPYEDIVSVAGGNKPLVTQIQLDINDVVMLSLAVIIGVVAGLVIFAGLKEIAKAI